jgi:hypothetical protein
MKPKKLFLLLIILVIWQTGCQVGNQATLTPQPEIGPKQPDSERTLSSLKRLSEDVQLYEMHYYGDYGLATSLQENTSSNHPRAVFACSCFAALGDPQERIFGRNFDWYDHPALVLFTDPSDGYASISMVDIYYLGYDGSKNPIKEPQDLLQAPFLPFDGMNEKGLAVGMMAVPHAEGGNNPDKTTIDELHLIRVLLDQAEDVTGALELMDDYNIDFGSVPVHYLIADAAGNSVVVEYLDGKPVALRNEHPWQVSTNFIISEENPQGADSSCWRYNRLFEDLQEKEGKINGQQGMDLLKSVAQDGEYATRWSWIFDLGQRTAQLAFGWDYQHPFEFTLK